MADPEKPRPAQEWNNLWEMVFHCIPDLVAVIDSQFHIVEINRSLAEILGIERSAARGMNCHSLLHGSESGMRAEGCPLAKMHCDECSHSREVTIRGHTGTFLEIASPICDPEGELIASVLILRDITDLKEAQEDLESVKTGLEDRIARRTRDLVESNERLVNEIARRQQVQEALSHSESRFRALCEAGPDCIYIKDSEGRYTYVNPAMEKLLDLAATHIVGFTDSDLFGKVEGTHSSALDARVMRGEIVEEEHSRRIGGALLTFLDLRAPMRNEEGGIVGICGIARDITDRRRPRSFAPPEAVVYTSRSMSETLDQVQLAAESDTTVLLLGESGSGKDHVALCIHNHSRRSSGPLFSLNCAAVPRELAESELFGHARGAFTGAAGDRRGLFELAEGGTLLLNEIGELDLSLQAKLLSFLDNRWFTRVGGRKRIAIDARIIAATNRDLEQDVEAGRFRADLFYRLNVMPVRVPPLRERMEDLPLLVQQLLAILAEELELSRVPHVDNAVLEALKSHDWPGNVRELRNVLERALIISRGKQLILPPLSPKNEPQDWGFMVRFPEDRSLTDLSRDIKRSLVHEALRRSGGNRGQAAAMLGISRHTLQRLIKKESVLSENET